jgi:hypothetical protein
MIALSRLRWFFVIARNSVFVYKGKAHDARQVGRAECFAIFSRAARREHWGLKGTKLHAGRL